MPYFFRSRSELDHLGIKSDEIKRATDRIIRTTEDWKNTMIAAEDLEHSHLEEKLKNAQQKLEDLQSLSRKKLKTWRSGLDKIQDNICKTENSIASCKALLSNKNDQRWKQRVKRKAQELFEERRVKRRSLSNQGRPCLLDSEDEEFLAKAIEDKATYYGRRKDTVMYTNRRVKSRDCLNIVNYNLKRRGRKLVKSYTTVYNRSRPKNNRSIQAKKHKEKGLFCFKKPPKAEDRDNENTKYQRGHVKNIKHALFAMSPSKEAANDDQTNESRIQFFSDSNEDHAADELALLYSADDKNYIRPGTSEGLSKTRNERILTLTDTEKAKKLPKYDWPEKLVYVTPAAHRMFTNEAQMENEKTVLTNKEDNHFVIIRPKAFVPSSGSVWASETVMLRHNHPDVFEAKCMVSTTYSKEFRKLCAQLNDYIYQYCDMSEKEDFANVTSDPGCLHNEYEKRRAAHCWKHLSNARDEFETTSEVIKESEMAIFKCRILPQLDAFLDQLRVIMDHLESSTESSTNDLIQINNCLLESGKQICVTMKELKLPPVKPRWVKLTDAGPGVSVSNFAVNFCDAELVRLFSLDLHERCHRSKDDSGLNEAERTNSAIGDAVVDGSTIEWEQEKRFQGMTSEEIDSFSLQEYEEYEYARMERNAWSVADEVQKRVDDAPVFSEYITAYTSQKIDNLFFFNEENLASYQKCNSDTSRNNVPGSAYIKKICTFQKIHSRRGEMFTEYVKQGCLGQLDGTLCDYYSSHFWTGPAISRIPQPVPDKSNFPHYLPVWKTPLTDLQGRPIPVDDYQPRVQIARLYKEGSLNMESNEALKDFASSYAVEEGLVKKAIEHLVDIERREQIRSNQRQVNQQEKREKPYDKYDWQQLVIDGDLKKLTVLELENTLTTISFQKQAKSQIKSNASSVTFLEV